MRDTSIPLGSHKIVPSMNCWLQITESLKPSLSVLATRNASQLLVVAHSYGGPSMVHLLKAEPKAREKISALAFTAAWVSEEIFRTGVRRTFFFGGH